MGFGHGHIAVQQRCGMAFVIYRKVSKNMKKAEQWYLYLLLCADGSCYTGITIDPVRREQQHRSGKGAKALRGSHKQPVRIAWTYGCKDRSSASRLEAAVKKLSHSRKREIISSGSLPEGLLIEEKTE